MTEQHVCFLDQCRRGTCCTFRTYLTRTGHCWSACTDSGSFQDLSDSDGQHPKSRNRDAAQAPDSSASSSDNGDLESPPRKRMVRIMAFTVVLLIWRQGAVCNRHESHIMAAGHAGIRILPTAII